MSRRVRLLPIRTLVHRSPQVRYGFEASINPYRGCAHACAYCYARDTHAYLGLDPGEGFSQDILVKSHVATTLERDLSRVRRLPSVVAVGTATDPYQSLEGKTQNTRAILEVLWRLRQPFTVTTKSPLVVRDAPLLAQASQAGLCHVHVSLITLDRSLVHRLEPGAPLPEARLRAIRQLRDAGVEVGLLLAPILPGLTDRPAQLRELLQAARDAGAGWVYAGVLRLPGASRDTTFQALHTHFPHLLPLYEQLYPPGHANLPSWMSRSLLARADRARREVGLPDHAPPLRRALVPRQGLLSWPGLSSIPMSPMSHGEPHAR